VFRELTPITLDLRHGSRISLSARIAEHLAKCAVEQARDLNNTIYPSDSVHADLYDQTFFVSRSEAVSDNQEQDGVTLIGPDRLAQTVLDAGLSSWLSEKVQ
jgi:hypothetical protein